jgi:nucleoside-diphosphate-sugar epimerase
VLEIFDRPFNPKNTPEPAAKAIAAMMEFASFLPFGNKKPAITRFAVGYMAKSMTLSIEKAKQKLGYSPRLSNREGFERYEKWYRVEKKEDN